MTDKVDLDADRRRLRVSLHRAFEEGLSVSEGIGIARRHFDESTAKTAETQRSVAHLVEADDA